MASLQDQLLKSGAINKGKAQRIQKEKQKQRKQKNASADTAKVDSKAQVAAAQAAKKARDQALNQQREQEQRAKARQAEIHQWIDSQRLAVQGEQGYQFVHDKRVKKLYVDDSTAKQLAAGKLAIVLDAEGGYAVVVSQLAEKIAAIAPEQVVLNLHQQAGKDDSNADNDPYADYQIPDDLMW